MISLMIKLAIIVAIFWGLTILNSYVGLIKSKNKATKKAYKKGHKRNWNKLRGLWIIITAPLVFIM